MMDRTTLNEKEEDLRKLIGGFGSAVVALSGGVDSSLVAKIAKDELEDNAVAVTTISRTYPSWDIEDAESVVNKLGIRHLKPETEELENAEFSSNPEDRCYHCKRELLEKLDEIRRDLGFEKILEGTNRDDHEDYRPGIRAIDEFGERAVSPLSESDFAKEEVRALAKRLDVPTAGKPSSPCLASRVPYGDKITENKLNRIEKSEKYLRSLGFKTVRVRDHGNVARIELAGEKIRKAIERRGEIAKNLREFGYKFVSLDLDGYRTGSLNPEGE